jgi:hypothetical protein
MACLRPQALLQPRERTVRVVFSSFERVANNLTCVQLASMPTWCTLRRLGVGITASVAAP